MKVPNPFRKNPLPTKHRYLARRAEERRANSTAIPPAAIARMGILAAILIVVLSMLLISRKQATKPSAPTIDLTSQACIELAFVGDGLLKLEADCGRFPTEEEGLLALMVAPQGMTNWNGPYCQQELKLNDPWGRLYRYYFTNGLPILLTYGEDGIFGNDDDRYSPWFRPAVRDRIQETLDRYRQLEQKDGIESNEAALPPSVLQ